jgi:acyl carrier protein
MTTAERLNEVFQRVFDNDEINIRPETTSNDVDGWDSLSHINLIMAVEEGFRIKFTTKEIMLFKNVGDLLKTIESKLS